MYKHTSSLFRRLSLCGLGLALFAVVSVAQAADAPPTFSDPEVTAFVKSYGEFTDKYAAVMKEYMANAKSGDSAKMQASAQKMQTISTESADMQSKAATIGNKIKPDEAEKYSKFFAACAQKMGDASK